MGSNDQIYLDSLETEKQAVANALAAEQIAAQPGQALNPKPDQLAAERWQEAQHAAQAARTFEELHGGVYAQSGRDTNTTLLAGVGMPVGSASQRQYWEGKLGYEAAKRGDAKAKLGPIHPIPDAPDGGPDYGNYGGWRPPPEAPTAGPTTTTEPSSLGWLAAVAGLGYLLWKAVSR